MAEELSPLLLGLPGPRADRESVRLLRETGAAGVLLLARNILSPAQTRRFVLELQDRLGRPLIVSIDHEGGWVLRFSKGLTAFPGNAALGKAGDPSLARRTGLAMGRELSALGIGLNLAPVLDVVGPAYNPGIIIRSFGDDPKAVSRLGASLIAGLQAGGVRACAKHFPGKGPARQDAHIALPTVRLTREELFRLHLPPFRAAVRAGVACVMTSHAVYPSLDPSRKPATFSRRIAHGLLRERLGYRGVLISDDLCMGAVTRDRSIPQAALEAFEAGHDLLIIAHAPQAQREASELLFTALKEGRIRRERWELSLKRARGLLRTPPRPGPLPPADNATARAVSRAALEMLRRGTVRLPLDLSGNPRLAVLWPDLREVKDRFTFEGGVDGPWKRLRSRLSRWPARIRFSKTPLLSGEGVGPMLKSCRDADIVLFFCFEAMRFEGQRKTLDALQKACSERLVAALLRNPWDKALLAPRTTALHAFGYRECQVSAILEALVRR